MPASIERDEAAACVAEIEASVRRRDARLADLEETLRIAAAALDESDADQARAEALSDKLDALLASVGEGQIDVQEATRAAEILATQVKSQHRATVTAHAQRQRRAQALFDREAARRRTDRRRHDRIASRRDKRSITRRVPRRRSGRARRLARAPAGVSEGSGPPRRNRRAAAGGAL